MPGPDSTIDVGDSFISKLADVPITKDNAAFFQNPGKVIREAAREGALDATQEPGRGWY